jgi:hypothetical protein
LREKQQKKEELMMMKLSGLDNKMSQADLKKKAFEEDRERKI